MSTAIRAVPTPSKSDSSTISRVCEPIVRSAAGGSMGVLPIGLLISELGVSRSRTAPSVARCSTTPRPCHHSMASLVSSSVNPCGVRCRWRWSRGT
eukprot:9177868-Alexandrium_andersonii.AAC.1